MKLFKKVLKTTLKTTVFLLSDDDHNVDTVKDESNLYEAQKELLNNGNTYYPDMSRAAYGLIDD